jgi:hypothetical protein
MKAGSGLVAAAALVAVVVVPAGRGAADTSITFLNVNSFEDLADFDLDDGVCDADPAEGEPVVTLRAAIQNANRAGQKVTVNLPAGTYALTLRGGGEDDGAAGDLDITGDVRVLGDGAATTVIDAKDAKDRAFDVRPGAEAEIADLTVINGKTPRRESGGGIRNDGSMMVNACVVAHCKASNDAGGIDSNGPQGTLQYVVIRDCKAGDDGGGVDSDETNLSVLACSFVRNKAKGEGGGIENSGGALSLQACTFSGNRAREGGAVVVEDGGFVTLDSCTLALNKGRRGGGLSNQGSSATISNNVFWNNRRGNCAGDAFSQGGNVSSDGTCPPGAIDLANTDALLAPLADNGGDTLTHALLPGSPAATFGINCGQGIDGRGVERPAGTCSSGAFQPE